MKNFGEFFNDQIEHASSIILSHTDNISEEKLKKCVELLREHNADATIITTPWGDITGSAILEAMEQKNTLSIELEKLSHEAEHHHHHHHEEHEHDKDCDCHEHNHEHEHGECHQHHHHDENCGCGHDHHHADDVFTSFGKETTNKYTVSEITTALKKLEDDKIYGMILRAKGIVMAEDGQWIHFDYVPGEPDVRLGSAEIIGRLCVIGSDIKEDAIAQLFRV